MVYSCSHLATAVNFPIDTALTSKEFVCADCDCSEPNLWICLHKNCLQIGCGEKANDHSTAHNAKYPTHCIHMNLLTRRIWCYECKREVFMDTVSYNDSDQETETCTAKSRDSGHGSYSTLRTNTPEKGNTVERSVGLPVGSGDNASDSSDGEEGGDYTSSRPSGLVGLQNIGNTCYMNAALQALSNTEPLTKFFLECGYLVQVLSDGKKPGLSRTYQVLIRDIWMRRGTQGYVSPAGILYGIRNVHATFRGYQQHDTQEFLRNFMDQLHEELKQVALPETNTVLDSDTFSLAMEEPALSSSYDSSEGEYETCDSGVSERSSLSDDTERPQNSAKRRMSRCGSPNRRQRQRVQSATVIETQPSSTTSSTNTSNKKQIKYRSIISDIFDGKLLSSVQCLTCDRISSRVETFQDLSLPIPSRDHLVVLHGRSGMSAPGGSATCSDAVIPVQDGWIAWILAWLKSWFYGPIVTLHDCLAAFFSTDELKGDNMYSCEKCNKLRNGVKFSKVLQLPEVLCIHLKRFRHELMFSSKISSAVSFPLKGLDMRPYLHTDCVSKVSTYELFSVICHHGTAGGGHYTCFALNSGQWYEFDDQYVTRVSSEKVQTCQAYVLFYQKVSSTAEVVRNKAEKILEEYADSPKKAYISRSWVNKFYYCAEPGPIDNSDFLCHHGAVNPDRDLDLEKITMVIPFEVYDFLYKKFGGCPPFTNLTVCPACLGLHKRLLFEFDTFMQITREAQNQDAPNTHFLSASWFTQWHNFVQKRSLDPPGPIDNSRINLNQLDLNEAAEVPESVWNFFYNIYGGGPELRIRHVPTKEDSDEENVVEYEEDNYGFTIPKKKEPSEVSSERDETASSLAPSEKESTSTENCDVKSEETRGKKDTECSEKTSAEAPTDFVIPTLKKKQSGTLDKSMYGHGEPLDPVSVQDNSDAASMKDVQVKMLTKNETEVLEKLSKDASNTSLENIDNDIDEEEGKQIRNKVNKRRQRRKHMIST
ncbi:unnamed protein product [Callosobruchus maculatus]|uniref:Ubiquitin carboxyl-terminal hydrolase n=1 Tax=Callosobruchus maculatus TaxID=64391 RepID=A0A653CBX2_CALMS|nr:unnamed protein product [Callosobruchus maculatus]